MDMSHLLQIMRTLKGAPLSCLITLLLRQQIIGQTLNPPLVGTTSQSENEGVNLRYLARMTGYTQKTLEQAMQLLIDMDLVQRIGRYSWRLKDGVDQFPTDEGVMPSRSEQRIEPDVTGSLADAKRASMRCAPQSGGAIAQSGGAIARSAPGRCTLANSFLLSLRGKNSISPLLTTTTTIEENQLVVPEAVVVMETRGKNSLSFPEERTR